MPGNIGPLEIAVVLIIVLIIFGPKRLPELGRSMGRGIREFRNSIGGDKDKDDVDQKRELEAAKAEKGSTPPETPASAAGTPTGTPAQPEGGTEPTPPAGRPAAPPAHGGSTPSSSGGSAEQVEGEIVTDKRV